MFTYLLTVSHYIFMNNSIYTGIYKIAHLTTGSTNHIYGTVSVIMVHLCLSKIGNTLIGNVLLLMSITNFAFHGKLKRKCHITTQNVLCIPVAGQEGVQGFT